MNWRWGSSGRVCFASGKLWEGKGRKKEQEKNSNVNQLYKVGGG
jgi:hypothetical protein